jgi:hypothetical protein
MQQVLRAMLAAFVAVTLAHLPTSATAEPKAKQAAPAKQAEPAKQAGPALTQIELTETQVQGVIAVQKEIAPLVAKTKGTPSNKPDPKLIAQFEEIAKKNGFKDLNEYDDVVANIALVMDGIDPKTKAFTEPPDAIKKEIAEVNADKSISARDKRQILQELNEALKSAKPIQFPGNVELAKKYYDQIDAALN